MTEQTSGPNEVATESAAKQRNALDRALLHGVAWTGAVKWLVQAMSWVGTLLVAKLLFPEDYGVAIMATSYIIFVQLLNELGLGAAIVQRRDLTESQIARIGGLSVLLGIAFALVSVVLATPVAWFFKSDAVGPVIMVLSLTFVTSGFQILPRALLTRDLRFRTLAIIEAVEGLVATVTTVTLALMHFSYWSLVLGGVAGRIASTLVAMSQRGHRLAWPGDFESIAPLVKFGSHILVASIAWYVFRNADQVFVGKMLGEAELGAYGLGLTLASIPVDRIASILTRATPAIFASVQNDTAALRRYLLAMTEGISLITFPASVGLALVADDIIKAIDADKWAPAVNPLRILALACIVRSLVPMLNQLIVAKGLSALNMKSTIIAAIVMSPCFFFAAQMGTTAVAAVWLIVYPLAGGWFFLHHATRACELPISSYFRAIWPAAFCAALMAVAVLSVTHFMSSIDAPIARLAIRCSAGVLAYGTAVLLIHGARMREIVQHMRALVA